MAQERERYLARILRRRWGERLEGLRVYEAGCGGGYNLRLMVQWGCLPGDVLGVDIDEGRISQHRAKSPEIPVIRGDAGSVPEPDGTYDLALAFTLFSSVHDEETAAGIADEMWRLTKPGGLMVVYDLRRKNPYNEDVRPIGVDDVRRWFPKAPMIHRSITLAPPVARFCGRRAGWLYGPLAKLPWLRGHYMFVMRKPSGAPSLLRSVRD